MEPNEVKSRSDFVRYIKLLLKDIGDFENDSLSGFLEALAGYTKDIDGYYKNYGLGIDADEPSWRVFADILKGALIYE